MRILYSFPHALGAPGIGTTAVNQVLALVERGHQVQVFAASLHKSLQNLPTSVVQTMVVAGVRIPHKVLGMDRTMALHDRRVARHLEQHASDFQIVHSWPGASLDTPRVAASLGIAAVREVPNTHTGNAYAVVAKLCDDLGIELPPGHSHRMNAARLSREEAEYDASFRLLTPSDHVRQTFLARGYPAAKLLRHQYGFDADAFKPAPHRADGPFHVVFLGTVEPRKGLHIALEAWRRSKAFEVGKLSIYGHVVEGYRPIIEPYLAMPGVELHDFTKDAASVLQSADALILPSFEEGSALVTYEAQGCGAVPIVSDAAGAQCVHGETGMIHTAGDVATLACHISELSRDKGLLARLRAAVLAQRDRLTWAASAERLEGCYEQARSAM